MENGCHPLLSSVLLAETVTVTKEVKVTVWGAEAKDEYRPVLIKFTIAYTSLVTQAISQTIRDTLLIPRLWEQRNGPVLIRPQRWGGYISPADTVPQKARQGKA